MSDESDVFELRRRVLRLETLYDTALALPRRRGREEIAAELLERAVALLDAGRGLLVRLGDDRRTVGAEAAGWPGATPLPAALDRDPLLQTMLAGGEAFAASPAEFLGAPQSSFLGAPLRAASGQALGAILLFDRETRAAPGSFSDDDRRFLGALAALGAVALEAASRFEALEIDRHRLLEENRWLRGRSAAEHGMIGDSPRFLRAIELARRAAPSSASVLIRGESGTGKELLARLVHRESERKNGPLVPLNCAAIPETLLEAELFGIERGVATGVDARPGKLELASGGTLFLDEIGDMPLALQAKLLRALAEHEIERVGGRAPLHVDVRVVAATHRPLEQMIESGAFRRDLYYRLRVIEVTLPSLDERREDVPLLVRHFLENFGKRRGFVPVIGRAALGALIARSYPGNVRELENLIEGLVALARPESEIRLEDLDLLAPATTPTRPRPTVMGSLRAAEKEHAEQVLAACGGNKSRAAAVLEIDRKTLSRLLGQ